MNDKVVIVTGGGRGIGRAVCQRFAKSGGQVVAVSRTVVELEETKRRIESATGRCDIHSVDVSKRDDVESLIKRVAERFGRIDVLVNCAGAASLGTVEELTADAFDQVIAVNVGAIFYACRAVWPIMKTQNSGTIINISSVAAVDPFPGLVMYGASKAWVNTWTKGLADEGAPLGIRVYAVGPGAVETRMLRTAFPDFPADQTLAPEEIADVVMAMAIPDNEFTAGETVYVKK